MGRVALKQKPEVVMAKRFPLNPAHPERVCWGCDQYCPSSNMACGNGASRTQHPVEVLGPDWYQQDFTELENQLPNAARAPQN